MHGNYEAIYDIEANTEKSVKFVKYFEYYMYLLPVGIDKKRFMKYTQAEDYLIGSIIPLHP